MGNYFPQAAGLPAYPCVVACFRFTGPMVAGLLGGRAVDTCDVACATVLSRVPGMFDSFLRSQRRFA